MLNEDEAFSLKREIIRNHPAVLDGHLMLLIFSGALFVGFEGVDAAVACRLYTDVDGVINQGFNPGCCFDSLSSRHGILRSSADDLRQSFGSISQGVWRGPRLS